MKKLLLLPLLCATTFALAQSDVKAPKGADAMPAQNLDQTDEPPMLGAHWAKGQEPGRAREARTGGGKTSSPNMLNHGGKIMPTAITQAIFWGTTWPSYSGDKITGIDSWYQGHNNSNYAKTVDEYSGTNGQVGAATTHLGHLIDGTAAANGSSTAAILAEVCKEVSPDRSGNGYYAVYTDVPRGSAGYCAYHSAGTCGGVPVQIAFFFKLDGDSGCDPQDPDTSHSQGLAALANVSGHEWSETVTDPRNGGWWDSAGSENSDKCAWSFPPTRTATAVVNPATSQPDSWKIQGNWSNAAFTAGTGYTNRNGQPGCLPN